MSKVLITGGAGFIGYFLAKKLSEDGKNHVTIVDNLSRGKIDRDLRRLLDKKNVDFIQGDLTNPQFLSGLDKDYNYIYHLSAIIGVKNVLGSPDRVLYVNAVSTINIFEYAKGLRNLKKIFFASTSEAYAGTMRHFGIKVPTDENVTLAIDDITGERTTYALSKIYGESAGFVYGTKYRLPIIIGRYHNVYGPRMGFDHVIPETFVKISENDVIDVPSPGHTRAFCFVDDAVKFTILACENRDTIGEIFHIGNSSEEISIKGLVIKISNVLDKGITVKELPPTPGSPSRRCPDTTKIEKLTGYRAKVSLDEGIRKTYEWYRDKLGGKG